MHAPVDCPKSESWDAFFGATLPPGHRERCERHLESCTACQERLDQTAEGDDGLLKWARKLGDPTAIPADATLSQVLELLHEVKSPIRAPLTEPADLYFLRPANRPNILGALGDYEVQEVIGQGGMGVVLKAYEPALHRLVAIKVMAAAVAGSATARRRFTREAHSAAAVCHDHVVTVHGVHETNGLPYLVMQYVAGESLQARLDRSGPLELVEIVRIGMQTAAGLAAAHAQGLIHRDIKPANLLLENGLARVKITDFGLARMVDDVGLTQSGMVAGTPEYMAPEQARGEPVDHRADLFSLGSVLYAMCTGVPPFRAATAVAVLRQVSDETPTPLRSLNPDVPAWLETLIDRLLAKDPADRFQSAAQVAALLEGYLAHLRQPTTVLAPELPPPPLGFQTRRQGERKTGRSWQVFDLPVCVSLCLLVFLVVTALGLSVALWFAGGLGGTPAANPHEYYRQFEGNTERSPELHFYGPHAEEYVQFEPAGLRITLPPDYPGQRPGVGLVTGFGVKGDFEITVSFEILKELQSGDWRWYTGLSLVAVPATSGELEPAVWHKADQNKASLSRSVRPPRRISYVATSSQWNEDSAQDQVAKREVPTDAKRGQLRLARTGSVLSYYASTGDQNDFTLLHQHEFGETDLKNVRIVGSTGGARSALDARVTDFRVQAESLTNMSTAMRQKAVRKWLWIALAVVMALLVGVSLVVGWRRRAARAAKQSPDRRDQAKADAASQSITFPCSGCRKNLKVKAQLAGKKVKCPQCHNAVLVPQKSNAPERSLSESIQTGKGKEKQ